MNPCQNSVREQVGASLACIRSRREQDASQLPWQSFHFSRYAADKALGTVNKDLDAYEITGQYYPETVITPDGNEFSCLGNAYD